MYRSRNGWARARALAVFALVTATLTVVPSVAQAAATCMEDGDGTFLKAICIEAPEDGATVSGTINVVGTVDPVNGPRTQKVEFYLDDEYVLTDFRSSSNSSAVFDFDLPTEFWVDGVHRLEMSAVTRAEPGLPSYTTQRVGIDLVFANGIAEVPPNTNSFTPSEGRPVSDGEVYTVAAVGDGVSGEPNAEAVADLLYDEDPNLFLYLGDVYEKGTQTEFYNWYGDETRSWGRLRGITNPTIGNHEYEDGVAPGYFDYWDNIPNFYSYDAGGWHFVNLNSTNQFRDNPEQFNWLLADIASNDANCTIAYWHDPRWSIGTQGDEDAMQEEWEALVRAGVDIFIGGNDHNYQRWEPLGVDGTLDPTGPVQFVAGSGGHGMRPFALGESDANPRVAKASDALDAFGALFLDLHEDHAEFRYLQTNGEILDEGSIACRDAIQPGYRGDLQGIRDRLDLAIVDFGQQAEDKSHQAIAELDKTLNDDDHWDDAGEPSEADGKNTFDKMKRAVEKLRGVDEPPAPIVTAIDAMVALADEMAREKVDAAVAANSDPHQIVKAIEHLGEAVTEAAEGEAHKAIAEYKKAWENARDGGTFDPVGFRRELLDVAYGLVAALPDLADQAVGKVGDAVQELGEVYVEEKAWDPAGSPSDGDGKDVFGQSKHAVEKLLDVDVPTPVVASAIDDLVSLSAMMAQLRIDAAVAGGGSQSKIDDALEHMGKALEKLAKGEPDKAIEEYKKAWEDARNAS